MVHMNRLGKIWVLLSLLLVATVWCVRPVEDIDVQWHLRAGEWMLDHRTLITRDFFSVSKWGGEWTSVPWLYEVVLAWLVRNIGWIGPTLWQWLAALMVTLQVTYLIWFYRRRGVDWQWPSLTIPAAFITLDVLRVLEVRFLHRPEMTTHVLLLTYLLVLALWRSRKSGRMRWLLWCLPLLQIVWVNTHGVFVLGPVIFWTFVAGEWTEMISNSVESTWARYGNQQQENAALRSVAWKRTLELTGVGILILLACFVTPYGSKAALYPLHLFEVLTSPVFKYGIHEGIPVSLRGLLHGNWWDKLLLVEWSLAVLGFIGRIIEEVARDSNGTIRHVEWVRKVWKALLRDFGVGYFLVCAAMGYVALTAKRNVPLFGLVAAPLAVSGLEYLLSGLGLVCRASINKIRASSEDDFIRARSLFAAAGRLSFALLVLVLYWAIVSERYYEFLCRPTRFAIGQSDHLFPIAGYNFLQRQMPRMARLAMYGDTKSADMFLHRFGPEWMTYIDGRHAEVYDAPLFSSYCATLRLRGTFFQEAGKYGIGLVVFYPQNMPPGQMELAKDLYRHPGWSLIYLDDCAVIYAVNVPSNAAVTAQYALPPAPADAKAQEQIYREWLRRSGHTHYDLYEQSNSDLCTQKWASTIISGFQWGGLWKPVRNQRAWQAAQVASFLSELGWTKVADSIYEIAAYSEPLHDGAVEKAIHHAIFYREFSTDPSERLDYLDRIRQRYERLEAYDPQHPTVQYGLAYVEAHSGKLKAAVKRLESLRSYRSDAVILDLLAKSYSDLGDLAEKPEDRNKYGYKAIQVWRDRLVRFPHKDHAHDAYIRLGDLFLHLQNPLLARVNYLCALNEKEIPSETAARVRAVVQGVEQQLFGTTFVPHSGGTMPERWPYEMPRDH